MTVTTRGYLYELFDRHAYIITNADQVLACLGGEALTLTELAHRKGYKGITAKLRKTVAELQQSNRIFQVVIDNAVKLTI